jgi:hypothetical protein
MGQNMNVEYNPAPDPSSLTEKAFNPYATIGRWVYSGCVQGIPYGFYGAPLPRMRDNVQTIEDCQKIADYYSYKYLAMKGDVG